MSDVEKNCNTKHIYKFLMVRKILEVSYSFKTLESFYKPQIIF